MRMLEAGLISTDGGVLLRTARGTKALAGHRRWVEQAKKQSGTAKKAAVETVIAHLDEEGCRRVLDVGTGEGNLAFMLGHAGFRVVGVDVDGERIRKAKGKADSEHVSNVSFLVGDISRIGASDQFDCAAARYVFHHLDDTEAVLGNLRRILKPGGKLACIDYRVGLPAFYVHGFVTFRAPTEKAWQELLAHTGYCEIEFHALDDLLVVEASAG